MWSCEGDAAPLPYLDDGTVDMGELPLARMLRGLSRGVSRANLLSLGTSFDLIDEASSFDTKVDLSQVVCPI